MTDTAPDSTDTRTTVPAWLHTAAAWTWRLLLLIVAGGLVLSILTSRMVVSLPVNGAIIVSTLAVPPARWLQARGLAPAAAASVVVIGGVAVIIAFIAVLTPSFVDQFSELGPTLDAAREDVLHWLETGPLGYDRAQVEDLLSNLSSTASGSSGSLVTGVLSGVSILVQGLAALLLFVVLLFFFVKDGEDIVVWLQERTPTRHRDVVNAVGTRAWSALGGYVRGTALIALIDALGIGIGLAILGVPLVLPLSVLVFLGGFIPVIGAFLAGMLAVLVALADGGFATAAIALAIILAVQQLEGNLLQPMIMRRAVSLHPIVILVAVAAGAALAGIVGAFLAVPISAVVSAAGNELRLRSEQVPAEA